MSVRLLLVRHCQSAVDPGSPPVTWGLTERGAQQARSLATLTDAPVIIAAGDEPKMVQTLQPLAEATGRDVGLSVELRESHSEGWLGDDEFLAVVRRFLEDPSSSPAPGWESAAAAAGRFVDELGRLTEAANGNGTVVVCSGGRVLTAALHRMGLLTSAETYRTWRRIGMPDVAEVLWRDGHASLQSPFGSGAVEGRDA